MRILNDLLIVNIAGAILFSGCVRKSPSAGEYPIRPVPFTSVNLTDNFWAPRIKKNADVTIPIAFHYCETTGRIKNFEIAGGIDTGKFQTIYPFDDSDVYKIIGYCAFTATWSAHKNNKISFIWIIKINNPAFVNKV